MFVLFNIRELCRRHGVGGPIFRFFLGHVNVTHPRFSNRTQVIPTRFNRNLHRMVGRIHGTNTSTSITKGIHVIITSFFFHLMSRKRSFFNSLARISPFFNRSHTTIHTDRRLFTRFYFRVNRLPQRHQLHSIRSINDFNRVFFSNSDRRVVRHAWFRGSSPFFLVMGLFHHVCGGGGACPVLVCGRFAFRAFFNGVET